MAGDENGVPNDQDEAFEIPVLPCGTELCFNLLENWGDANWIGINCIEIFTNNGGRATIENISTSAIDTRGDLNYVLIENFSCTDGAQMWCASTKEIPVKLTLILTKEESIAMIRIWNYNESRVHAQRGVRCLSASLNGRTIFKGDIKCAYVTEQESEGMGDTILFTTDEKILEAIAQNDLCLIHDFEFGVSTLDLRETPETETFTPYRPATGELVQSSRSEVPTSCSSESPLQPSNIIELAAKVIHIELLSNWGCRELIGLTGIEIFGPGTAVVDLSTAQISVTNGDAGIEKIINGRNLTRNEAEMWLSSFSLEIQSPVITIQFQQPEIITGLSFWNYNASPELSYAGVREAKIFVNGKLIIPFALLRKAPGFVFFDYVQDIPFLKSIITRTNIQRPLTRSTNGFIFQIRLLSTWGDEFYVGLNGIELWNRNDRPIKLKLHNLAAFPESVNILPMVEGDPRTSENLIDGINDTDRAEHMWLTPVLPNRYARIFFIFDEPTMISKIIIYNYRKTPTRGVRHFSISVDDLIAFSGEVPPSTHEETGVLEVNMRDFWS